jgi:O-antigen/teichoic acid export membrane protein
VLGLVSRAIASFGMVTINVVALAIFLGVFAIVTARLLGPTDRGIVVVFVTLSSMLMVVGSFGANTFARVNLVSDSHPLALSDYFGLVYVLSALQVVLSLGFGAVVLHATHSYVDLAVLGMLMVYSVLNLITYLLRDGLYAFGHNVSASKADPIAAAAQVALAVGLWLCIGLTLHRAFLAVTIGQTLAVSYLVIQYRRHDLRARPTFKHAALVGQIRGGAPALITNLGQSFIFRLDRMILGLLATTAAVGIYSVSATLTEAVLLIPISISQVVFHLIASAKTNLRAVQRLRLANLLLCIVVAALLAITCPWLVRLLFGDAYMDSVQPLRILLVGAVAMGSYLLDVACVNAAGHFVIASELTIIGLTIVTAMDVALIPSFGMTGAAIASAVGYVVMAVMAARRVQVLKVGAR